MPHPYESLIGYDEGARKIHVHRTEIDATDDPDRYMHTHEAEEAVFVLEGKVRYKIGEEAVTAGPGETLFFPAGVEHGPLEFLADRLEYLVIRNVEPGEECCCEQDTPPSGNG